MLSYAEHIKKFYNLRSWLKGGILAFVVIPKVLIDSGILADDILTALSFINQD